MTKEISAGSGFHLILTGSHHYMRQNVVDPPNATGQVLRPGDSAPHTISIPILRQSVGRNHLPPPVESLDTILQLTPTGGSLPASRSLSPLNLPIPAPFQHAFSTKQTTTTPVENTFPPVPPYPYADPFPGNRLAPIPNLEASNDPTRPTSPPYDPEQVVRDREALRLPSPPPQASAPSRVPTPPVISCLASPIIVDASTPQSPTIPLETDWHDRARESEAIWPGPPTPALPPSSPPPPSTPTPPASQYYWECGHAGHLIAGCSITSVRA